MVPFPSISFHFPDNPMKPNLILQSRRSKCRKPSSLLVMGAALGCWLSVAAPSTAQEAGAEESGTERPRATAEVDREAKQLYDQALELMDYKQYDRAVAMLETVVAASSMAPSCSALANESAGVL